MRRPTIWVLALSACVGVVQVVIAADVDAVRSRQPSDYKALKERPLFSPSRSAPVVFGEPEPVPVAAAPEPPPPPPAAAPDWELVGLVRSVRLNSATFRAPGIDAAFSLRTGESRDGWTLTEVGRFDVTLDSSTGRASVRFPDGSEASSAVSGELPMEPLKSETAPQEVPLEETPAQPTAVTGETPSNPMPVQALQ